MLIITKILAENRGSLETLTLNLKQVAKNFSDVEHSFTDF